MKIRVPKDSKISTDPNFLPEKVMIIGDTNSGKTRAALSAYYSHPEANFYVIDPDDGVKNIIAELGGPDAFPNLQLFPVKKYPELLEAVNTILAESKPGDWVMAEMLNRWWDHTQSYFSEIVYGNSLAEQLVVVRAATQQSESDSQRPVTLDGLKDWQLIKKLHNQDLIDRLFVYSQLNAIATTASRQFNEYLDKTMSEKDIFAKAGVRPEGEKHLAFVFNTILFLTRVPSTGKFFYETIKERGAGSGGVKRRRLALTDYTDENLWESYITSALSPPPVVVAPAKRPTPAMPRVTGS